MKSKAPASILQMSRKAVSNPVCCSCLLSSNSGVDAASKKLEPAGSFIRLLTNASVSVCLSTSSLKGPCAYRLSTLPLLVPSQEEYDIVKAPLEQTQWPVHSSCPGRPAMIVVVSSCLVAPHIMRHIYIYM